MKLIIRSFEVWKREARSTHRWYNNVYIPQQKRAIDSKIESLRNEIKELQQDRKKILTHKLDISKEAYNKYVQSNKEEAEKENMILTIDDGWGID